MDTVWAATRDTKEAAVFSTLGVPVRLDSTVDEKSGKSFVTFYLGSKDPAAAMEVSRLRKRYNERSLPDDHPIIWCQVALRNRERLLDFLKKGRFVTPENLAGGQWLLRHSNQGLPGIGTAKFVTKTPDLKMAIALVTLGVELLMISGPQGAPEFYFAHQSRPLANGDRLVPEVDALIRDFRNGTLVARDPEHPLLYAMLCQRNRDQLINAINKKVQMVLLRKPYSQKSALVAANATDHAWDRARRFFGM